MDVRFTSDYSGSKDGILLDVKSITCGSDFEKVVVDAAEVLEGAIVTDVESDGKYPNKAIQKWKIITDENQCIVISIGVSTHRDTMTMSVLRIPTVDQVGDLQYPYQNNVFSLFCESKCLSLFDIIKKYIFD